ncbi:hypothetical protein RJT34_09926 [Clitoria ternatea]|uniref:RING-type E3 ubiquitin transferase n=1 Tax=Clitoria ternatea TaxID=43366 RepID=A0AAN9K8C8_CLITE
MGTFSVSHSMIFMILTFPSSFSSLTEVSPTPSPSIQYDKKTTVWVVSIVVVLFLITCFLSFYTRQRGNQRGTQEEPRGLNPELIKTFPTLLYSTAKHLMLETTTLACAVCLDEYHDNDNLRFIPKCNHVFHLDCIDTWLDSHSTCPVCRANLNHLSPSVAIQITEESMESPKISLLRRCRTMNENPTGRSRSTGFLFDVLFPRCNSTGRVNLERFTLRLPEEVRRELVMKRTRSSVSFRRMRSGRRGYTYRTRSLGSRQVTNFSQRFHGEDFISMPHSLFGNTCNNHLHS